MTANEKTRLVSSNPENAHEDRPKFKKSITVVVAAVLFVGMVISVAATTQSQGNIASGDQITNTDSIGPETEKNNAEPLAITEKPSKRNECQLPEQKLSEIRNMQSSIDKIIDHVLNGTGKGMTWKKLANFVDTFGPRFSGTQSLEDSIDSMIDSLTTDGLENVHGEEVMIPHWVRRNESAVMIEPRVQELFMLGLGGSIATPPEGITAEVIVVKSFQELSNKPAQVRDYYFSNFLIYSIYGLCLPLKPLLQPLFQRADLGKHCAPYMHDLTVVP